MSAQEFEALSQRWQGDLSDRLEWCETLAVSADNMAAWLVLDAVAQKKGWTFLPLPLFFTQEQVLHALNETRARVWVCPQSWQMSGWIFAGNLGNHLQVLVRKTGLVDAVFRSGEGAGKVTFTSGTTGSPKGIWLSSHQQWVLAADISRTLSYLHIDRHLCLLPLPVLLENVAGVYSAMLSQATLVVPKLQEVGLMGSSGFDAKQCLEAIEKHQAQSVILLPQMLRMLTLAAASRLQALKSLKFVAVGGAKTPIRWIEDARAIGIPVYEGYGLSECASVVCMNHPQADLLGSAGRALGTRKISIDSTGQIIADGIATGDLGKIDEQGYLHLLGRQKNVLITAFGRNVSPEWPESLLSEQPCIAQVMVLGDGLEQLQALIVPNPQGASTTSLQQAIDRVNAGLPDYARIGHWQVVTEPWTPQNGMATANGRPRRQVILERYAPEGHLPIPSTD